MGISFLMAEMPGESRERAGSSTEANFADRESLYYTAQQRAP